MKGLCFLTSLFLSQTLLAQSPSSNGDEAAGAAACAACGTIYLFIIGAFFILTILMLVWVASDAKNRGVDTPALWVLILLVSHFIGLIVYLCIRPTGPLVPCPHCGKKKLATAAKCPHCGNPA